MCPKFSGSCSATIISGNGACTITTDDGTITTDNGTIATDDGTITTDDGTIATDDGTVDGS